MGVEGKLTLNICRPNSAKKKLPVMVYLHGGGFQIGNTEEWLGNKFCEMVQAVHVGIEFRKGALGFNPLPSLHTGDAEENSGNYALLDIITALHWIQRNIESFGGDPENVTISGLSSGGRAAVLMMICPLARGLFHKVIAFSAGLTLAAPEPSQRFSPSGSHVWRWRTACVTPRMRRKSGCCPRRLRIGKRHGHG